MNKSELIATVSEKLELPRKQVKAVVEAVLETVGETLERGEEVTLTSEFSR